MTKTRETESKVEAIERLTRAYQCPHCQKYFKFMARIAITGIRSAEMSTEEFIALEHAPAAKRDTLTPEQRRVVEEARAAGVMDAFAAAVKVKTPPIPADLDKFFIFFMSTAVRAEAPQFAIRLCLPDDEPAGNLEAWSSQGVIAVTSDGTFRAFVPKWIFDGKPNPKLGIQGGKPRVEESGKSLAIWVRTRNGYVVGRGLMFDALKKRAAGSFDTMSL